MNRNIRFGFYALLTSAIGCGAVGTLAIAQSSLSILGPSSYSAGQVEFKETKLTEDGKVRITYSTPPETTWFCPGANARVTEQGVELTFLRSWFKKRPKVQYPSSGKPNSIERVIVVESKGKPIFIRSDKTLKQIWDNTTEHRTIQENGEQTKGGYTSRSTVAKEVDLPKQAISPEISSLIWVDVQSITWDRFDQSLDSLIDTVPRKEQELAREQIAEARELYRASFVAWEKGVEAGIEKFVFASQPSPNGYSEAEGDEADGLTRELAEAEKGQLFVRMRPGAEPQAAMALVVATARKQWKLDSDPEAVQAMEEAKAMEFVEIGDGWFAARDDNMLPLPTEEEALDVTPFVRALQNHEGALIRFAWLMDDATRHEIDQARLGAGAMFFGGLMTSLRDMKSTSGGVWLGQQPKVVLDMDFADEKDAKTFKGTLDKMVGFVGLLTMFGSDESDDPEEAAKMKQTRAALALLFLDRDGANLSKTFDSGLLKRLAAAGLPWTNLIDQNEVEEAAEPPKDSE